MEEEDKAEVLGGVLDKRFMGGQYPPPLAALVLPLALNPLPHVLGKEEEKEEAQAPPHLQVGVSGARGSRVMVSGSSSVAHSSLATGCSLSCDQYIFVCLCFGRHHPLIAMPLLFHLG